MAAILTYQRIAAILFLLRLFSSEDRYRNFQEEKKKNKTMVSSWKTAFWALFLFQFKSTGIQLVILAFLLHQGVVVASFQNMAVFHDHNQIGILNGGKTVGNDKDGAAVHQSVHAFLYQRLCSGIDAAGGFVQDHDRWIGHGSPGNVQQLALPLG